VPGGNVGERIVTIGSAVSAPDRSVSDRYALWRTAAAMWRDHPIAGVGPKRFAEYRDVYAPLELSSGSDVEDAQLGFRREPLLSPHNMYLLVLSEQGLLGAVGFGLLLASIAAAAWRRRSVVAVGIMAWTLVNFAYGDIGGATSVFVSVLIGLAVWWALAPVGERT